MLKNECRPEQAQQILRKLKMVHLRVLVFLCRSITCQVMDVLLERMTEPQAIAGKSLGAKRVKTACINVDNVVPEEPSGKKKSAKKIKYDDTVTYFSSGWAVAEQRQHGELPNHLVSHLKELVSCYRDRTVA